ncbi:uncharacterized protein LOC111055668 isoform X3 [Nilaparvata lugens]|uniref:uncharacterized protein LOC111055668 isoform X3 n=1 Tax=Nilaparvata lugens TaxID=108931 RepID=UPI000B99905C|nr:uncharacterized protein LOC111055668 isoform X3 [Nilaparvata lugens]
MLILSLLSNSERKQNPTGILKMLPNFFCISTYLFLYISLLAKFPLYEVSSQKLVGEIVQSEEEYSTTTQHSESVSRFNDLVDALHLGLFDDNPAHDSRYSSAIFHANHPNNRIRFHDTRKQHSTTSSSALKKFVQRLNTFFMGPVNDTVIDVAEVDITSTFQPRSYDVSSTAADHSFKNRSYFVVTQRNAKPRAMKESGGKNFKGDY